MADIGSAQRPLRVAVVGSGPSGFYAADALLKSEVATQVDIIDRLPTPYGLVRLGVAPDHQKIKNVTRIFDKIAAREGCEFYGNVTVGRDVSVDELRTFHDAIVFASGAESDRKLNISGEDLPGSHTATAFVAWYNGHPDYRDHEFDLSQKAAVVIGQGNVAVDVCRMLAKTVDELKDTDIAQHALDALAESRIEDIYMVGRRGPVQAKFTQLEIKEMGKLADCDPIVSPADMQFDPISQAEYDDPENKAAKKIIPILREFSQRPAGSKKRRLHILFTKGPKEILGTDHVEGIVLEKNELVGEPFKVRAKGTAQLEGLPCGLVFRSVGYRSIPIPGVPFNHDWGLIANKEGRVMDGDVPAPGLYTVGWAKRGPSGVIGTNKPDSYDTIKILLSDLQLLTPCANPNSGAFSALLDDRGVRWVSFEDWKKIDKNETDRGQAKGKPREKFTRVSEMLAVLETQ